MKRPRYLYPTVAHHPHTPYLIGETLHKPDQDPSVQSSFPDHQNDPATAIGGTPITTSPRIEGQLKVQSGGILWKKQGGGKAVEVDKDDIVSLTWMKVPRSNQLGVRIKDGLYYKFTGFHDQESLYFAFSKFQVISFFNYFIADVLDYKHLNHFNDNMRTKS